MNKKKISLYIILFSFLFSIFVSQYNVENFDKNIYTDEGIIYHQMIKSDPYRYLSEGHDIKKEWDVGVFFLNLVQKIIPSIYHQELQHYIIIFLIMNFMMM